jgi:anaerobic magnesium-protoporphyrin IX monomethyl ester cyclase
MNVLLVNPYYICPDFEYQGMPTVPLSLAYLAGYLEAKGISVKIIDLYAAQKPEKKCFELLNKEIKKQKPDVIGVTSVTAGITSALKIIDFIKKSNPKIITVLGGAHPTYDYENILKTKKTIDFIVRGEGEIALFELVRALENKKDVSKILGLAYRINDIIKTADKYNIVEDLDTLPFPARHLLDLKKYPPSGMLLTSRGCPYKCNYCIESSFWGTKPRFLSIKRAVDEMELLINKYKYQRLLFLDSTFTVNKKRVLEICKEIRERNIDVMWGCYARIDTVSQELLNKMRKAGCSGVYYGVETLSVKALKNIHKIKTIGKIHSWNTQVTNAIKWAKKEGMYVVTSFMLGLPGETKKSSLKTIRFLKKMQIKPDQVSLQNFVPFPGSEFFINHKKYDINFIHKDYERFSCDFPVISTNELRYDEIISLKQKWKEELKDIPNLTIHI